MTIRPFAAVVGAGDAQLDQVGLGVATLREVGTGFELADHNILETDVVKLVIYPEYNNMKNTVTGTPGTTHVQYQQLLITRDRYIFQSE